MTDNHDDQKSTLESALNAVEKMRDNDDTDALSRIFDAISVISFSTKQIQIAADELRKKFSH